MPTRADNDLFPTAEAFLPPKISMTALRESAAGCQGCPLYQNATQTVFGRGPLKARLMFVGEQPGDQEDQQGEPFVGPAGRLLDEALVAAGIRRGDVYVTNAVKHFKWTPRGKRRIHGKPNSREIAACKPWLTAEVQLIKPELIVCLGATAAQTLMGPGFRITRERGRIFDDTQWAPWLMATVHPSSLLRIPGSADRRSAREAFTNDLRLAAEKLGVQ
jgi:uracil-DNA glycosylase